MRKKLEDNLKHVAYGEVNIGSNKFMLNGFSEIRIPYHNITSIYFLYKTYNANPSVGSLPNIGVRIKAGNTLNVRSSAPGIHQQINVNQTMRDRILSIELTRGPLNRNGLSLDKILMSIEFSFSLS